MNRYITLVIRDFKSRASANSAIPACCLEDCALCTAHCLIPCCLYSIPHQTPFVNTFLKKTLIFFITIVSTSVFLFPEKPNGSDIPHRQQFPASVFLCINSIPGETGSIHILKFYFSSMYLSIARANACPSSSWYAWEVFVSSRPKYGVSSVTDSFTESCLLK